MITTMAATKLQKISSAIFYSCTSILIILVNKFVLTSFHFPSFNFLGLAQICATVLLLGAARLTGERDVEEAVLVAMPNWSD